MWPLVHFLASHELQLSLSTRPHRLMFAGKPTVSNVTLRINETSWGNNHSSELKLISRWTTPSHWVHLPCRDCCAALATRFWFFCSPILLVTCFRYGLISSLLHPLRKPKPWVLSWAKHWTWLTWTPQPRRLTSLLSSHFGHCKGREHLMKLLDQKIPETEWEPLPFTFWIRHWGKGREWQRTPRKIAEKWYSRKREMNT